ncbi:glycoside hydrolase, family 13 [Kipferlia bialata]|uniref:Glycoside hydrolase, family 13 n=1 Tax=Kipferlia bialata TaxID=797122 RepID=A0A9K3GIF0_9EUKA|nr:glycoside hydrolase, family 13 [Kipferlia bialata]|eukprot:g5691.t1
MSGSGNDIMEHRDSNCVYWPGKTSSGALYDDIGGSPYYTQGFNFQANENTFLPPIQEYPGVPYGPLDFHCERALNSWTDPLDLNAGWLVGLTDINTERQNVQERIADYIVDLLSVGFSGHRIDAAKHIHPNDIGAILGNVRDRMGGSMPEDYISWLEVLLGGEKSLLMCDQSSPYSFSYMLTDALKAHGFSDAEVDMVKIWNSGYPVEPRDCSDYNIGSHRMAIQNDDHDQSYGSGSSSRDMQGEGSILTKEMDIPKHRGFETKLFNDPYAVSDNSHDYPIRLVLSGYYYAPNGAVAIPDGWSDCTLKQTDNTCNTVLETPAFQADKCGYEGPTWTRVHRDMSIVNAMRSWMGLGGVSAEDVGLPGNCS